MRSQLMGCGAAAMLFLTACSGGLSGSAGEVRLRTTEQLQGCENVGATHVSVVDKLGQPDWNPDRVADELQKLAIGGAIQLGGNAIVEMTEVFEGTQSFAVFSCSR